MEKFKKPEFKIDEYSVEENRGKFVVEPLERGFGTTLGNALRRVLLSSLPGTAMYAIEIEGIRHEFSAIAGVEEDVTSLILNLKAVNYVSESYATNQENEIKVNYPSLAKSVTPGQACVFYDKEKCLGCGFIKDVYKEGEKLWYLC